MKLILARLSIEEFWIVYLGKVIYVILDKKKLRGYIKRVLSPVDRNLGENLKKIIIKISVHVTLGLARYEFNNLLNDCSISASQGTYSMDDLKIKHLLESFPCYIYIVAIENQENGHTWKWIIFISNCPVSPGRIEIFPINSYDATYSRLPFSCNTTLTLFFGTTVDFKGINIRWMWILRLNFPFQLT